MKITFSQILIAVVLSSFAYATPVRAQNILDKPVNISLNNTTLLDVVNYLQKKNGIKFIYSKNTVDMAQKVNANFKEQPLKVVLDELFKNNGIDYEVLQDRIVLGKLPAGELRANTDASPGDKANRAAEAIIAVTGKVIDAQG
ncbi:MAG TPA: STN domain-containing protein, partial [Mucilaginibacter sp.]|nr:STN domain-containing protein [Mucilaginibacter sp.]